MISRALLRLLVFGAPALSGPLLAASSGNNLVTNPSFESGSSGWSSVTGTATVTPYGSPGGPDLLVRNAIGGGGNYLSDTSSNATIEQIVPVGPIPAGMNVRASAYLGGAGADGSGLIVRYLNAGGGEISRDGLDTVTLERRNWESVLLYRAGVFAPPPGTVSIAVQIQFTNTGGAADGAADLVCLELTTDPVVPPAVPLDTELLHNGDFENGWNGMSPLDLNSARSWVGVGQPATVKPYSNVDSNVPSTTVSCLIGGGAPGTSCIPGGAGNLLVDSGNGNAVLRQRLDVRGSTSTFSPFGSRALAVSAFLGGVGSDPDAARVDVRFLSSSFVVLSTATPLGPVTAENRNQETVVLRTESEYLVPQQTAYIEVDVAFIRLFGSAQGLLDNVSARLIVPTPPTPIPLGINLIRNSGFENGSLSGSPLELNRADGWRGAAGSTEVLVYGSSGAVPPTSFSTSNGLGGRVAGDLGADSILVQSFSLNGSAGQVDAGGLRAYMGCWFGGVGSDPDSAEVFVECLNAAGNQVGPLQQLFQVTPANRANATTLVHRFGDFAIPPTTRTLLFSLRFIQTFGAPDGLADGASLVVYEASSAGFASCAGDGSGTPCVCGNHSGEGDFEGCLNSLGLGGKLRGTGIAAITGGSLVLHGSQMPSSTALYIQSAEPAGGGAGTVFGDGLLCAGGSVLRLGARVNAGGASQFPNPGQSLASIGNVVTPGVRFYQVWYRNAANFCSPARYNLTNGWQVSWSF